MPAEDARYGEALFARLECRAGDGDLRLPGLRGDDMDRFWLETDASALVTGVRWWF